MDANVIANGRKDNVSTRSGNYKDESNSRMVAMTTISLGGEQTDDILNDKIERFHEQVALSPTTYVCHA